MSVAPVKLTALQQAALQSISGRGDAGTGWFRGSYPRYRYDALAKRGLCEVDRINDVRGRWIVRITDAGRAALEAARSTK